jgi:hypothetical protein
MEKTCDNGHRGYLPIFEEFFLMLVRLEQENSRDFPHLPSHDKPCRGNQIKKYEIEKNYKLQN